MSRHVHLLPAAVDGLLAREVRHAAPADVAVRERLLGELVGAAERERLGCSLRGGLQEGVEPTAGVPNSAAIASPTRMSGHAEPVKATPAAATSMAPLATTSLREQRQAERMLMASPRRRHRRIRHAAARQLERDLQQARRARWGPCRRP